MQIENNMSSVPVGHSIILKEKYEIHVFILDYIDYKEHEWLICANLKIVCLLNELKLYIQRLCAAFVNGPVGPNQNIMYTQNGHLGEL